MGYSPRGRKELNTTERLTLLYSCIYNYIPPEPTCSDRSLFIHRLCAALETWLPDMGKVKSVEQYFDGSEWSKAKKKKKKKNDLKLVFVLVYRNWDPCLWLHHPLPSPPYLSLHRINGLFYLLFVILWSLCWYPVKYSGLSSLSSFLQDEDCFLWSSGIARVQLSVWVQHFPLGHGSCFWKAAWNRSLAKTYSTMFYRLCFWNHNFNTTHQFCFTLV